MSTKLLPIIQSTEFNAGQFRIINTFDSQNNLKNSQLNFDTNYVPNSGDPIQDSFNILKPNLDNILALRFKTETSLVSAKSIYDYLSFYVFDQDPKLVNDMICEITGTESNGLSINIFHQTKGIPSSYSIQQSDIGKFELLVDSLNSYNEYQINNTTVHITDIAKNEDEHYDGTPDCDDLMEYGDISDYVSLKTSVIPKTTTEYDDLPINLKKNNELKYDGEFIKWRFGDDLDQNIYWLPEVELSIIERKVNRGDFVDMTIKFVNNTVDRGLITTEDAGSNVPVTFNGQSLTWDFTDDFVQLDNIRFVIIDSIIKSEHFRIQVNEDSISILPLSSEVEEYYVDSFKCICKNDS